MPLATADFELLLKSNRILSSTLDPADVLKTVLELATQVVKAETSSLLLLDDAKQELYFDVALGEAGESVKQIRLKVGEGVAGSVAKDRKPLIVNDVSKDPRFSAKADKSSQFKTKSILAVPLTAKGKLIGVVEAINKAGGKDFSAEDQEVFEVFASQAAIAIENSRLFSEVTREKEKLNTVFAQMSEGVFLLDPQGNILLMNEAGSRFVGKKPSEITGKKFGADLFPGFATSLPWEQWNAIQEKTAIVDLERRAGKDFFVSASLLRLTASNKSTTEGLLVILQDHTEEKRGERLKRNFLSLISHKLKTPLTVIVGYAPILSSQTDNLNDFQKKAVNAISDQGQHLIGLVDKLLRFTLVESESSESLVRNPAFNDVASAISQANSALNESLDKPAQVTVDPSLSSAPKIYVDPDLVVEVFKNLLENAVKFNDKADKKVNITGQVENDFLRVNVEDNGVGIPAEEYENVFQKFYQVENSFTGQVPGAGLGLTYCKKVIEAMGGKIQLQSKIGQGTVVSVAFPLKKPA